ncbi:hypothetical protein VOWphi5012_074 [Vibrio phage phi50-12]|uniref:Uncharacterized protein n=1 Tax=Vibrio phage phi50-12 TaxID=2654972 RepID=A0A5P8PRD2_9CAUD|nr:hypothetical protein KNU82_gp074 [Vibrio phage phi50-12]QFR59858.1 hypothetical protein VOWphi5012_074 [Vibrio phage phi50-12]
MLKKYLIQLEPSHFGPDVMVLDFHNLRKPITVTGRKTDNTFTVKPPNQLDSIVKINLSETNYVSMEWLYSKEFTIIMEKPYKNENN